MVIFLAANGISQVDQRMCRNEPGLFFVDADDRTPLVGKSTRR